MRSLLDVNVLIALLDADHVSHDLARSWFNRNARAGWASCPLTQNGCVRIMSHVRYPSPVPVQAGMERLREATTSSHHAFWPDDVTLLDERVADAGRIHGPRQLTDLYLLALAVRHGGRLVTFDRAIAASAIRGAGGKHLCVL
ncbi:MAG: TA system VapC family ribonuclease toxin [Burkholderiales bacterium]